MNSVPSGSLSRPRTLAMPTVCGSVDGHRIFVAHRGDDLLALLLAVGGEADLLHRHFLAVAQIDGAIDLAAAALAERFDADELAADRPFAADGLDARGCP